MQNEGNGLSSLHSSFIISMAVAYISVGSNIEPEKNALEALRLLAKTVRVTGVSTFYLTEALHKPGSPRFYNGVVRAETSLSPRELKYGVLREIERALGRTRGSDSYAPRTIDLDIAIYDDAVIDEPGLVLPDPDIRTRPFVAIPLLELAPDLVLADTGATLSDVVEAFRSNEMEPLHEFTAMLRGEVLNEQAES